LASPTGGIQLAAMKSLLAKIAMRKVVGLYLGDHEVSVSEVAVTPLGPIQIFARTEPCQPNDLMNAVERALQSLQTRRRPRRLQVGLGIPLARMFFGTQMLRGTTVPAPESVLQKLFRSSDISVDDLTYDMAKITCDKTPVACVAACRKKYMTAILASLQRCGGIANYAEPAACALVRAASHSHRTPRRAKTILWFFLGKEEGTAVLTVSGQPLAWRAFALPSLSEGMAILSSVRTLLSHIQYLGIEVSPEYVIMHGRPDLHERLQKEGLPAEVGARMIWRETPAWDGATAAFGLALGCIGPIMPTFDMARGLKPPAALRDIFPWGELVGESLIMAFLALVLMHQSDGVSKACESAQLLCGQSKTLAMATVPNLEKEKKELSKKIDFLHKFLDSRTVWTGILREFSDLLPKEMVVSRIDCDSRLNMSGGGGRKALAFPAMMPMTPSGAVPLEVGKFVQQLRNNPRLKQEFSSVESSGLRRASMPGAGKNGSNEAVAFSVRCQPAAKGKTK
jgi:hypothetical protein